jgi:hypothetical protein
MDLMPAQLQYRAITEVSLLCKWGNDQAQVRHGKPIGVLSSDAQTTKPASH